MVLAERASTGVAAVTVTLVGVVGDWSDFVEDLEGMVRSEGTLGRDDRVERGEDMILMKQATMRADC